MANSAENKSGGYERGKTNVSSGNKNSKHANQKAKDSAAEKYKEAKTNYEKFKYKANRTPEDKKMENRYKTPMEHWKHKMEYTGENHSRNAKGNR